MLSSRCLYTSESWSLIHSVGLKQTACKCTPYGSVSWSNWRSSRILRHDPSNNWQGAFRQGPLPRTHTWWSDTLRLFGVTSIASVLRSSEEDIIIIGARHRRVEHSRVLQEDQRQESDSCGVRHDCSTSSDGKFRSLERSNQRRLAWDLFQISASSHCLPLWRCWSPHMALRFSKAENGSRWTQWCWLYTSINGNLLQLEKMH